MFCTKKKGGGGVVTIYSPYNDIIKKSLWGELVDSISWWELPLCIGGGFNVTRFPVKSRDVRLSSTMKEFLDFISE
jgi:hypothetical protein